MSKNNSKYSNLLSVFKAKSKPILNLTDPNFELPKGDSILSILSTLHTLRLSGGLPRLIKSENKKRYIALCFVIVDKFPHEEIWKYWLNEAESNSNFGAKIFIHAKFPERLDSEWVKERLISKSFAPEWNSPEVVKAILELMNQACHSSHDKFSFDSFAILTESCIPVRPLEESVSLLTNCNKSWLNPYNTPNSRWEFDNCFNAVNKNIIPAKTIWKSLPGWIVIHRQAAIEIVELVKRFGGWDIDLKKNPESILAAFGPGGQWTEEKGGVWAPEEVFLPTMLSILGYLKEGGGDQVIRKSPTYAQWIKPSDPNPKTFTSLENELFEIIIASEALFARKFNASLAFEQWRSLVYHENNSKKRKFEESK